LGDAVHTNGKYRWEYRLPSNGVDCRVLWEVCARMQAFEKQHRAIYRDRFRAQARRLVAARLGARIYPDRAIRAALTKCAAHAEPTVRGLVVSALRHLDPIDNEYGAS
jgi:hypothetical protein